MQKLIDANALNFEKCTLAEDSSISLYLIDKDVVDKAPTVLEIPGNPTNGDMVRIVFNDYGYNLIKERLEHFNWWNSPYKRGTEVENTVSEETYTEEYNRRKEAEFKLYKLQDNIDKMIAEINKLRGCSCSNSDGIIDDVEDIIDKYCKGDSK